MAEVTAAIVERSRELRQDYLQRMAAARPDGAARGRLSCANLAHVMAAAGEDKSPLQALAAGVGYSGLRSVKKSYSSPSS